MKFPIALLAVLALSTASAQRNDAPAQLPLWAEQAWMKLSSEKSVQLSKRLNPFVWRGDFNADGRPDLAVLVVDAKTGKEGVAFLLRGRKKVIVGAGRDFGNGGDDFSWMDHWYVEGSGAGHGGDRGQSIDLKGDGLMVAKEGSASAPIYFRHGKAVWRQIGD